MFDPLVSNEVLGIATTQFRLQQKKPRRFVLVHRQHTLMSLQKEQSDQCISRGQIEASMSEVAPKRIEWRAAGIFVETGLGQISLVLHHDDPCNDLNGLMRVGLICNDM